MKEYIYIYMYIYIYIISISKELCAKTVSYLFTAKARKTEAINATANSSRLENAGRIVMSEKVTQRVVLTARNTRLALHFSDAA